MTYFNNDKKSNYATKYLGLKKDKDTLNDQ